MTENEENRKQLSELLEGSNKKDLIVNLSPQSYKIY